MLTQPGSLFQAAENSNMLIFHNLWIQVSLAFGLHFSFVRGSSVRVDGRFRLAAATGRGGRPGCGEQKLNQSAR